MEWHDSERDPWFAADKFKHVLFCFALTLIFSVIAHLTRYPFLRRHSILIGSICSLLVGATKEAADQLGFFRSAGASAKDAVSDIIGVLLASLVLSILRRSSRYGNEMRQDKEMSLV